MSDYVVTPGPAISLDSGAPAGAGDVVSLDAEQAKKPHNARQIASGRLVEIAVKKPPTKAQLLERAKELDIDGRSSMNADQLAAAIAAAETPADAEKEND